jgi:hypothetical protein
MFLECVTVCVEYDDFLSITLALNKKHFDDYKVVTIANDMKTQSICRENKINTVITKRLYENGDLFNKGKAINDGLKEICKSDWILLLDADIILPNDFRHKIESYNLDKENIYGCPYFFVYNLSEINNNSVPIYSRPYGYFQLFSGQNNIIKNRGEKIYPEEFGTASKSDSVFFRFWNRKNRSVIDKMVVKHLSGQHNWSGRTSERFLSTTQG